jgi:predicted transport protein
VPSLEHAVEAVLERAQRGSMNESNTKVLLVEPILQALGWDTTNLDCVTREHKVYDGTFLDYALLAGGRPVLFVEAKAWGATLSDPRWMAQTVNYANNEGVVWCALSDGISYRVYKTNEPVDMARKLVFEVDLREYADEEKRGGVLRSLQLLSRDSVVAGRLDALGSRLFDEARIRRSLEELFSEAPNRFVTLIRDQLPEGERRLTPGEIREVLKRIGKGLLPSTSLPPAATVAAAARQAKRQPPGRTAPAPGRRQYTFDEHFGDKPQVIVDLYTQLHERLIALDSGVERLFRKQYVGYRLGKSVFCSVIPQKQRLRLILPLEPSTVAGEAGTRDVSQVGHWGVGNTEVSLESDDQLDAVMQLAGRAAATEA